MYCSNISISLEGNDKFLSFSVVYLLITVCLCLIILCLLSYIQIRVQFFCFEFAFVLTLASMILHTVRVGKQRLREARMQAVDFLILLLAGICLGTLAEVSDETFGTMGYLYTVIAVRKFKTLEQCIYLKFFHLY